MNDGPWTVSCRDVTGRARALQVLIRGSLVVVVAPAGEAAVLAPGEAEQFRAVLAHAAWVASCARPAPTSGPATLARLQEGEPR
jgi:hypothetical protein